MSGPVCAVCHDEGELAVLAPCSVVSTRVRALLAMDPARRARELVRGPRGVNAYEHVEWARRALRDGMRRIKCECRRYTITVAGEPVRDEVDGPDDRSPPG